METKDLLTLIGWPVSCLLSILAGGYIIPRLTRKRRVLSWATVSESELIPSDLADTSAIPIKVEIDGVSPRSVTLVTIRVGNLADRHISPEILMRLPTARAGEAVAAAQLA